ncbi:MAG: squalene/phytoene synthase family protein [Gammaproteobacteria bacterium]
MTDAPDMHAPVGSDFYYASLYYPPRVRTTLNLIESLRRELLDIPASCSDRGVAHIKLAWWREELGTPPDTAPRHHLSRALRASAPALAPLFAALAARVAQGLGAEPPADDAALAAALEALHGDVVGALVTHAGGGDDLARASLVALAGLVERANALGALRQHRNGGWLYLSRATLAAHGLGTDALRYATRSSELGTLVSAECARVQAALERGLAQLPRATRRRQRLVVTLARIARARLVLTQADGCAVLERRVEPTPVSKLGLAWRTRWWG